MNCNRHSQAACAPSPTATALSEPQQNHYQCGWPNGSPSFFARPFFFRTTYHSKKTGFAIRGRTWISPRCTGLDSALTPHQRTGCACALLGARCTWRTEQASLRAPKVSFEFLAMPTRHYLHKCIQEKQQQTCECLPVGPPPILPHPACAAQGVPQSYKRLAISFISGGLLACIGQARIVPSS